MCGICGIHNLTDLEPPDVGLLRSMMSRLKHRGPDSSGYYRDRRSALGHTRLAIVDVAGGAQPICNEARTVWLTFNGEVYNHVELRAELETLGHRFSTRSDSEAIVHAYEQWGSGCFPRFNGQWAVGLWDAREGTLLLSRDRLGVRPLYYTVSGGRLLFASEVKAIFADPSVPRQIDVAGMAEILTFWCTVAPRCPFAGVRQVEPGTSLVVREGRLVTSRYWSLSFPPAGEERDQDLAESSRRLREELVEAARLRFLRSDVPVGAYLSGGLDSSVISAIVARYTQAPLTTYGIRFQDAEFDEGPYQREMARRLGADHRDVMVAAADIGTLFPSVVWHAESPLLRTAPAPLYALSRLVNQSALKVVVTGEGSDEVLGGYDLFREAKVRLFMARDPHSQKRAAIVERLYPWMKRGPSGTPAFAAAFFGRNLDAGDPGMSHRPRWDAARGLRLLLGPDLKAAIEACPVEEELLARLPAEQSSWDPLCRAQWIEVTTLLSGYILSSQGDRMLMAHGVEGRFPFLDRGVVSFAGGLPARHKVLGLEEKYILKSACSDLVPEAILRRPKQPYRAPDSASFFSAKLPWLEELLAPRSLEQSGLFDPRAVGNLLAKCRSSVGTGMSNTDNMRAVCVISTMLLEDTFIRGNWGGHASETLPHPLTEIDTLAGGGPRGGREVPC